MYQELISYRVVQQAPPISIVVEPTIKHNKKNSFLGCFVCQK